MVIWVFGLVNYPTILFIFAETNIKFAPENGWLEDDRFLLGPG